MDLKKILLVAFVFSGMAALIYEVVWTRPLQFILGSTIYTVSIIFAAFMAGLALGSFIVSKYADKIKNLPAAYAYLELGIGIYGVLLLTIFNILPDAYRIIYPLHKSFYAFEILQFLLSFAAILIPTMLMGATFPIIARFYTRKRVGKAIGEVYSANNLGAIIGSFAGGFILVPLLGIKTAIIFAAVLNIAVAFVIIYKSLNKNTAVKIILVSVVVFISLALIGKYNIEKIHTAGAHGMEAPKDIIESEETFYYKEGLHATVTVRELPKGGTALFINGKGQGSTVLTDMRVNFLLSYLPLLTNPESENGLVIGLGTGTTSGQLAQFVDVTTVEIEPAILEASKHFWFMNADVLRNPNHKLVIADGRNYLLRDKNKYDIIIPEPCDPWQSFSSHLYSKEFFEIVKEHLNEGGLYLQWVPIYELNVEEFKSFYNTFSSVFPNVIAFANVKEDEILPVPVRFGTSEIIFVGSKKKIEFEEEKIKDRFDQLPAELKATYFEPIGLDSSENIMHLLLFTSESMEGYAKDAKLMTDDMPLLEFSTSRRRFNADSEEVIQDIKSFLKNKNLERDIKEG